MNLSTRFVNLFGLLLITGFAVSCAQSEAPTSPSTLSVGSSTAALGPGAAYNASGMWRFVVADVHGNEDETFEANVSQDGNGNLSFRDSDGNLITLERLGTGVVITYRLVVTGDVEETECDLRIHGTARLDTRTDTMSANVLLRELGCSHEVLPEQVVTATKIG
jgi:hypothetical protein